MSLSSQKGTDARQILKRLRNENIITLYEYVVIIEELTEVIE
tara:strand:- start:6922 stop:7047 length:126 start_codon:yes stop_codon:yes gene_type:complete